MRGAVLFILIPACRKNGYSLGPFVTDERGEVRITREGAERAISAIRAESPMDYADDLEECLPILRVDVESRKSLQERWSRIKDFYPEDAGRLRSLLNGGARLASTASRVEIDMSKQEDLIDIEVT